MDLLDTARLLLRRFTPEDWRALYEYLSDDEVVRFLPEWPCTMASCRALCVEHSRNDSHWAVCLKASGQLIGHVTLHREYNPKFFIYEVGYVFNPRYHKRGYATEACRRLMRHGFEDLKAHRIIATCDPENAASWAVMERLHMRREAHFQKCLYLRTPPPGESIDWRDEYVYAIRCDEWRALGGRLRKRGVRALVGF